MQRQLVGAAGIKSEQAQRVGARRATESGILLNAQGESVRTEKGGADSDGWRSVRRCIGSTGRYGTVRTMRHTGATRCTGKARHVLALLR